MEKSIFSEFLDKALKNSASDIAELKKSGNKAVTVTVISARGHYDKK